MSEVSRQVRRQVRRAEGRRHDKEVAHERKGLRHIPIRSLPTVFGRSKYMPHESVKRRGAGPVFA